MLILQYSKKSIIYLLLHYSLKINNLKIYLYI